MIKFDNSYLNLPNEFYSKEKVKNFSSPKLILYNNKLGHELFNKDFTDQEVLKLFSGQYSDDNFANIALNYSGHQFGHFNPTLGDGRALLLGEILTKDKKRYDLQLKGSGPTAYSRRGDGFSALGPVLREYIVSEFMHKMNIPTTRALCAVETGDLVQREESLKGGLFTRVASSHIRIGTFEYFSARHDFENLKKLTEYSIQRHYPELIKFEDDTERYIQFMLKVATKQSSMIAKWYSAGFIHGVMNTDNMSISGETIDYGPCAFMDHFKFDECFSYIDKNKRYAYNNQKNIGIWNLFRFASALIPLINADFEKAQEVLTKRLSEVESLYEEAFLNEFSKKFGLKETTLKTKELIDSFLTYLEKNNLDFTESFRNLINEPHKLIQDSDLDHFLKLYQEFDIDKELANSVNPIIIPRNHILERMIENAYQGDYNLFLKLADFLKQPFSKDKEARDLLVPPKISERIQNTFCGT